MVAGDSREGELVTTRKRELDPYTLRYVARRHGRRAAECAKKGFYLSEVTHIWIARHWETKARTIESRAKRRGRKA